MLANTLIALEMKRPVTEQLSYYLELQLTSEVYTMTVYKINIEV